MVSVIGVDSNEGGVRGSSELFLASCSTEYLLKFQISVLRRVRFWKIQLRIGESCAAGLARILTGPRLEGALVWGMREVIFSL